MEPTEEKNHGVWRGIMISRDKMKSSSMVVQRDRKSWTNKIKDISSIGKEHGESISEGITRLNKALRNDKRKLRSKTQDVG